VIGTAGALYHNDYERAGGSLFDTALLGTGTAMGAVRRAGASAIEGEIGVGATVRLDYTVLQGREREFMRQLAGQEAGINKLTAGEIRNNIDSFNANGRPSSAGQAVAGIRRGNPLSEDPFVQAYLEKGFENGEPRFAALHEPDMVIGGNSNGVTGYGDLSVNSSLGSQNRFHQNTIYQAVQLAPADSYIRFIFGVKKQ